MLYNDVQMDKKLPGMQKVLKLILSLSRNIMTEYHVT